MITSRVQWMYSCVPMDQRRNELSSQFLADGGVSSLERVLKAAIKSLIERRRAWCKYLVAHLDAIKSGA